jgi:paraquat-inducible protein A
MAAPERSTVVTCCRCGLVIARGATGSLSRTAALSVAALIMYVPANIYPILSMRLYGAYSESTIWDGCVSLFERGEWLVATIVFLASILIPLFKLLGLFFLTTEARRQSVRRQRQRTLVFRAIGMMGPWAMLDVFLLSVLVALVKLKQLATVLPGPGLIAFTAVVVLTILAVASFDPKLIWPQTDVR